MTVRPTPPHAQLVQTGASFWGASARAEIREKPGPEQIARSDVKPLAIRARPRA